MDAPSELTKLTDRDLQLGSGIISGNDRIVIRPTHCPKTCPEQSEGERQRNEPLLGAIVQISFESAPLGIGGFDDPRSRATELGVGGALVGEVADDRSDLVR